MNPFDPVMEEHLNLTLEEPTERAEPEIVTEPAGRVVPLDGQRSSEGTDLPRGD